MTISEIHAKALESTDKVKFRFVNKKGQPKMGKFVNANLGLFHIKGMPTNATISIKTWLQCHNESDFDFQVVK